jgi:hypothetical protein
MAEEREANGTSGGSSQQVQQMTEAAASPGDDGAPGCMLPLKCQAEGAPAAVDCSSLTSLGTAYCAQQEVLDEGANQRNQQHKPDTSGLGAEHLAASGAGRREAQASGLELGLANCLAVGLA